jgi:UDP-N-acetylmuramyl pentapeptide phosphotransferase/UDP-N-acetylglucosamine-1-phosphate transferase
MKIDEPFLLLLAALLAALISAVLIYLLRPALQRYALARPNARSSHRLPTPQGAGIAVIAATLTSATAFAAIIHMPMSPVMFGATLFIALVGAADDIRSIPVAPRLLLQATAVGAIVFWAPSDIRIVNGLPLVIERSLTFLAGVWFVNLVNFMDGLDLMTAAEVVPVTGAMVVLGLIGELPTSTTMIAATLCGAMLGFAPFNRPIARVFLGDVGSLPIGLLVGSCLLELAYRQHLAAALLLPLYYLGDATLTLISRIARRERFWEAHRMHFYQRATDHGFPVISVVGHVFTLNLLLGALAVATTRTQSSAFALLCFTAGAFAVALVMVRFSAGTKSR